MIRLGLTRSWLVLGTLLLAPAPALAWHGPGHALATRIAAIAAAKDLPDFFAPAADTLAHLALDPDTFTRPIAPKALHDSEAPEHYFDVELADVPKMPAGRYDFLDLLFARKMKPAQVGLLPYAITDWAGKLTIALAEHRKWPADPAARQKCLVYAGLLAHYTEDLCQPLHTTIHYDGRVTDKGRSPRTGIHMKLDALPGKLNDSPADLARAMGKPAALDGDLLAAVMAAIGRSHALVDRVYGLENDLPAYEAALKQDSPAADFARERIKASADLTAAVWLTAWRDSARVQFPDWHTRPPTPPDKMKAPTTQPG